MSLAGASMSAMKRRTPRRRPSATILAQIAASGRSPRYRARERAPPSPARRCRQVRSSSRERRRSRLPSWRRTGASPVGRSGGAARHRSRAGRRAAGTGTTPRRRARRSPRRRAPAEAVPRRPAARRRERSGPARRTARAARSQPILEPTRAAVGERLEQEHLDSVIPPEVEHGADPLRGRWRGHPEPDRAAEVAAAGRPPAEHQRAGVPRRPESDPLRPRGRRRRVEVRPGVRLGGLDRGGGRVVDRAGVDRRRLRRGGLSHRPAPRSCRRPPRASARTPRSG